MPASAEPLDGVCTACGVHRTGAMKTKSERAMVGLFERAVDARATIEDLRSAHFSDAKIGILVHDKDGDPEVKSFRKLEGNEAAFGAGLGALAGASGGTMWAIGISAGFLPAIGPVLAGGLLVAIAASAATGAAAGVLVGALGGLGIGDADSAFYDAEFRKGHTIIVVDAGERGQLVESIMGAHGVLKRQVVTTETLAQQLEERHI